MLDATMPRLLAGSLTAAFVLALAACGDNEGAPEGAGATTAGSSMAGRAAGGQTSGGSLNSGSAGTSGSAHGGSPASTGGTGGAPSGGMSATAGAGGASGGSAGTPSAGSGGSAGAGGSAAGAAGAAGAGGTPGTPTYSTDPKTFGGQPRCQGFDVCESFESTELGALPAGFTLQGYGTRTVGVSADRPMRGARSLKIEISAQSAVTAWLTRGTLGALGAQHFGRAFYRIEKPAPAEFVHFDLLEATGPYQGHTNAVRFASTGTGVGTSPSNWSFIYNVQPSGNGAGSEFGTEGDRSAHARVDDWMCLEWSFDATKQVAQYYLDGAAIDYLRIDTERAEIPTFDSLAVGFGKYQNTAAFLVYLDEVAFDGERIGCNN